MSPFLYKLNNISFKVDKPERVFCKQSLNSLPLLTFPKLTTEKNEIFLSQAEIQTHSLIRKSDALQVKSEFKWDHEMTIRIGTNFAGGGLVTGAAYDGLAENVNFSVWLWLIKSLLKQTENPVTEILENIKRGLYKLQLHAETIKKLSSLHVTDETRYDTFTQLSEKLATLKAGESEPFIGGYSNVGAENSVSHAQIIEFRRRQDGDFDLILFSSTHFQLVEAVLIGLKVRIDPVVYFLKIPEDVLFLSQGNIRPCIPLSLSEPKIHYATHIDHKASDEDILRVLEYLEGFRSQTRNLEIGAITGQRGGTCLTSVTKTWIRWHMHDLDLYKQMMFQCKLKLLVACYLSLEEILGDDTTFAAHGRLLLTQIARNILRSCAKINLEAVTRSEALATAFDILNKVEELESKLKKGIRSEKIPSDLSFLDTLTQRTHRQYFTHKFIKPQMHKKMYPSFLPDTSITLDPKEAVASLFQAIERTKASCDRILKQGFFTLYPEEIRQQNFKVYNFQLHHLLDQIPLPTIKNIEDGTFRVEQFEAPFWNYFSLEDLIKTQKDLYFLFQNAYLRHSYYSLESLSRRFATLIPLQVIFHFLSLKIEAKKYKKFPLDRNILLESYPIPNCHTAALQMEHLLFLDRQEFERIQKAIHYIRNFNSLNFNNSPLFQTETATTINKAEIKSWEGNGTLWNALLENDQNLNAHIEKLSKILFPKRSEPFVDLPPITKSLLTLGKFNSDFMDFNPLEINGYGYFDFLRALTYLCRYGLNKRHSDLVHLIQIPEQVNPNEYKAGFKGTTDFSIPTEDLKQMAWAHRQIESKQHLEFLNSIWAGRKASKWKRGKSEGVILHDHASEAENLLNKILRVLPQWKIAPQQIFYELSSEFKELNNTSLQGLLLHVLFRSPIEKEDSLKLGLGDLVTKNRALLEQAKVFIEKGLRYSLKDKALTTARFFFELSFYLSKYLFDAGLLEKSAQFNQIEILNDWLEKKDFSSQERASLHLYRVCFYSIKPALNFLEDVSAHASWILYNQNPPIDQRWKSAFIEYFVTKSIIRLTSQKIEKLKDSILCTQFGNALFSQLNLVSDNKVPTNWHGENPGFVENGEWSFDLKSGKIYKFQIPFETMPADFPWEKTASFKRVFQGQNGFEYSTEAGYIYFKHKRWGDFRLIDIWGGDYVIQRKMFGREEWFQYSLPETLELAFPKPLIYDRAFWKSEKVLEIQGYKIAGYITHLKTDQVLFVLLKNGEIHEIDGSTGIPKLNGYKIDYLDSFSTFDLSPLRGIANFDLRDNIVTYRNRFDGVEKISFPRYTSIDGNTLQFLWQNGRFVFAENRNYAIPKEIPKGLLGTIPNYLFLESVKSPKELEGLLLVPCQEIQGTKSVIPQGILQIANQKSLIPIGSNNELIGTQFYCVYRVENEKIHPLSLEAKIFLAYIYLSQRKGEEAVALLSSIKSMEIISPLGMEFLNLIQELPLPDDHPDIPTVKLHALGVQVKQKQLLSKKPFNFFDSDTPKSLERLRLHLKNLNKILQGSNNISHGCRLPVETEKELLTLLFDESCRKFDFLRDLDPECLPSSFTIARRQAHLSGESYNPEPQTFYSPKRQREYFMEPLQTEVELVPPLDGVKTISEAISWFKEGFQHINLGTIPKYSYLFAPTCFSHFKNGKLFLEVFHIVNSKNAILIKEIHFRLKLWRQQRSKNDPYLDFLIVLLHKWKEFSKTISSLLSGGSDEKIYEELSHLQKIYKDNYFASLSSIFLLEGRNSSKEAVEKAYPLSLTEKLHTNEKKVIPKEDEKPFLVTFGDQKERWSQLHKWKEYLITDTAKIEKPYKDIQFIYGKDLLNSVDQIFEDSLKKDFELLQMDYEEGKRLNETTVQKMLPKEKEKVFLEQVQKTLTEVTLLRQNGENLLLLKANWQSPDEIERAQQIAKLGGKFNGLTTLQDCVELLLAFDRRKYLLRNPHVNPKEVAELTLQWLDLKSYEAQLKKIESCLLEIAATSSNRGYLTKKLEDLLEGYYHFQNFTVEEQVVFRVFSGQTGNIPYKIQIDLIKKLLELESTDTKKYKEKVIQLIMGGGKTSIIAAFVMYFASKREGRLGFFVVPPAQFKTLVSNFREIMQTAFGKQIFILDLTRSDMSSYTLKKTDKMLQEAMIKKIPVLISATTLQGLELEELSLSRKIRNLIRKKEEIFKEWKKLNGAIRKKDEKRQQILKHDLLLKQDLGILTEKCLQIARILHKTSRAADAFLDEVDQLLSCDQELYFIDGEKSPVDPQRNQLLLTLYKGLISKEMKIQTLPHKPTVKDFVNLHTNSQTLLSSADYLEHVAPLLASWVASKYKPVKDTIENYKESFVRYASGRLHASKSSTDQVFLKHLHNLYQGSQKQKAAANLIAMTKHFILDLIPLSLSKMGGRNYGQSVVDELEIVPYRAVNAPAPPTTKHGYPWEAASCHYQWGAAFKPTPKHILQVANLYLASAHYFMEKNGEKLEETAEYLEFKEIFGITLNEIEDPQKIQDAIQHVSKTPEILLDMQYELVGRYATFASDRLVSNGFDLLNLVNSTRAMSATPWDVEGYDESLAKNYLPSLGTEGRILHMAAKRGTDIYEIDFHEKSPDKKMTMRFFLEQIYQQHRRFEKIQAIIDSGALLKSFGTNEEVAKEWVQFLQDKGNIPNNKIDTKIQAVLFFHREPDEIESNTVYVYRFGADKVEKIGSSSPEALKAQGLVPGSYVVLIDERHKDGTDILLSPDAIALQTFDEKMLLRTDTQSKMRCRQYLFEQQCDIVINKETRKSLYRQGSQVHDLILHEATHQSIRKAQAMVRYFTRQIHHIFRKHAVKKIREANLQENFNSNYANLVDTYEKFFVQYFNEEPYLQHGRLETWRNTKEALKELLQTKWELFKKTVQDWFVIPLVQKDVEALSNWIDQSKSLPKLWKQLDSTMGLEQEIELQVEQEIEVEQEVELELRQYEQPIKGEIKKEIDLDLASFKELCKKIASQPSLKEKLGLYKYEFQGLCKPYLEVFNQPILGTHNYFNVYDNPPLLPIFHPAHRSAKQILVAKVANGFWWLLLSAKEAQEAQKHLQYLYKNESKDYENYWLIQPDGSLLVKNAQEFPLGEQEAIEGLIEINALLGNIDYLDQETIREYVFKWFSKNRELKFHFLKLKTYRNKAQYQLLHSTPFLDKAGMEHTAKNRHHFFCKTRQEMERNKKGNFKPDHYWQTKILDNSKHIQSLNTAFVPYLGIDLQKNDEETQKAVEYLISVEKCSGPTLLERVEELNKRQFESIHLFQAPHLTFEQVRWLPPNKTCYLSKPEQIVREVSDGLGNFTKEYSLSERQVGELEEEQGHLIPFIDPKFFPTLKYPWQIQALRSEQLIHINPNYVHMISQKQIQNLTEEVLKMQIDFFDKLFVNFSPEQISWFPGNLLNYLPKEQLIHITQEQIEKITDPELIPKLESIAAKNGKIELGKWTSWIAPAMVPHLTVFHLPYLTLETQIQSVKYGLVSELSVSQINLISVDQVEYVCRSKLPFLHSRYFPHLQPDQVPHLKPEQIPHLHLPGQIQAINNPTLFSHLTNRQIYHISVEQLKWITPNQIRGVRPDLLKFLSQQNPNWKELVIHPDNPSI